MAWLAGISIVIAAVAVAVLLIQRHNLRTAARDLADINRTQTDRRLRLTAPDPALERLLQEVNLLVDEKKAQSVSYERRDQELRQEIANISHDLRTPLTSIRGYLQLIRRGDCSREEQAEYLTILEARAETLQLLITGFYDLSRLEAGGYTFDKGPVRLDQVLYELVAAYYADFERRQMEPQLTVEEDLPPITADVHAVGRVFTNLLQNALKHGQGPLRIVVQRTETDLVTIFTNRAPGLLPQDVEHLFDRFYTADTMRTGRNTGLGLAIVRKLTEQMGAQAQASLRGCELSVAVHWPLPRSD